MDEFHQAVREALGQPAGHLLDWRMVGGCQLVSLAYRRLLPCPYREGIWQCEVIGPHEVHDWSDHLKVHERMGNGYRCSAFDGVTLADLYRRPEEQPTKLVRAGI